MNLNRRQIAAALAATALPSSSWVQAFASAADIPAEAFFAYPHLSHAKLNPSGTHVALCVRGENGRMRLGVLDLVTMKLNVLAAYSQYDVMHALWINDQRLAFEVWDKDAMRSLFSQHAIDVNGKNMRDLPHGWNLIEQGPQKDGHVLMSRAQDSSEGWGFLKLVRVNSARGEPEELEVPPWSQGFLIDHRGEPVAALAAKGDKSRLYWRQGEAWRMLREADRFYGDSFALAGIGPDGTVYVTANRGSDRSALYTYDPASNRLSDKPVLALAQFDMEPSLVFDDQKLLGVRVEADALVTVWLDEGIKALQAKIDAKLPETGNHLALPRRGNSPWVLVWTYSDRQPPIALIYNRETDKLAALGRAMPKMAAAQMSSMRYTPYTARDGRTIPAYLTLPASAAVPRKLPLVVLVHGGPFVRGGSWSWQPEVQFLASRGYAVLQPEFRGSTGFGEGHFKAGWKQWGQAMQDDLADGARWAVAHGHADPARIAIAGASYGGYAALMGLARQSDVFACAVSWLAVTDLDLIFGAHWSDQSKVFKEFGLPKVLGDRTADAEMLKAHSPLHLARQIRKPVLLAYGERDSRVPIQHGQRMREALEGHNPHVEWVLYEEEGHGWHLPETHRDFWTRVERFLARHLKPASS